MVVDTDIIQFGGGLLLNPDNMYNIPYFASNFTKATNPKRQFT